jgi:hypothetical protein
MYFHMFAKNTLRCSKVPWGHSVPLHAPLFYSRAGGRAEKVLAPARAYMVAYT